MEKELIATLINITDEEFGLFTKLIYERFGIYLSEQKKSLVMGRLNKILKKEGFSNFKDYYHSIIEDKTGRSLSVLIDRITTNHTYFYRENDHFEYFSSHVLPEIIELKKNEGSIDFRIWIAGCSSGEEVYTILMVLYESLGQNLGGMDIGILATDISLTILETAKAGLYSLERMAGVSQVLREKYFSEIGPGSFQVKSFVRDRVLFKRLNLKAEAYPFKGKFDIIFCRNVMIYFDSANRNELVQRFYNTLNPGGYLFIGHSESITRSDTKFQYIRPALYKKPLNPGV